MNVSDIKLVSGFIDNVESTYEDIRVECACNDNVDGDLYVTYNVIYDGAQLFKLCVSYMIFTSGDYTLDYTLLADISQDSFQTSNIIEFEKYVIEYIKEIV